MATGTTFAKGNSTVDSNQLHNVTRETPGRVPTQTLTPDPPKVVSTHRHPDYCSYPARLSSYSGWPTNLVQTPKKLAAAGFFYIGTRDIVRCFSCDGGLREWDPSDDPWIEHCMNFPHCVFLTETKGEDNIALTRSHHDQPKVIDLAASKPHTIYRQLRCLLLHNVSSKTSTTEISAVIETLSEMGYIYAEIQPAIEALSRNNELILLEAVIDEIEEYRSKAEPQTRRPKDIQQLLCMKCKTANINVVFLPCQHQRFCTTCADSLTVCTVCGRSIVHKI